jgi:myo-inositol-1(or 4)-monophosphatase
MAGSKKSTKAKPKKKVTKSPKSDKSKAAKKVSKSKAKSQPAAKKPTAKKAAAKKPTVQKAADKKTRAASPGKKSSPKPLTRNFLQDIAQTIKDAVAPAIADLKGAEIVGQAPSGDATFEIDLIAEKALLNFLKNAKAPVAYYSEEAGYTTFTNTQPTNLLVIDPIDGTRAAKSGFEGCCVSICSTRIIERPTIGDIDNALVLELVGNRMFYAEKGNSVRYYVNGHSRKIRMSENDNLEEMTWSMTVPARPAELIFPTAATLIDITSLKGGFFACNSSSFSITRLVSGQMDCCVDVANRFYRDLPVATEDFFINAGRGTVLGSCPYDFAAALIIAEEAGCVVTDAYGENLHDVLLLDSSQNNFHSIIAASTPAMHRKLLEYFETRIIQLENLLKKKRPAK